MAVLNGIRRSMRIKQWVKNLLVFVVPVFSWKIVEGQVLVKSVAGFLSFSLIASGAYMLNDVLDIDNDRRHPRKMHRPIAAGVVSKSMARAVGTLLVLGGVSLGFVGGAGFALVGSLYAAHTFLYSFKLKHIATVEMVALSAGFILRVAAGGVLARAETSQWLFACIAGGALLMASGKRSAELRHAPSTRNVLGSYNEAYLTTVRSAAVAVAVVGYALWIYNGKLGGGTAAQISILPYLTAILRYAQISAQGEAGEPEDVVMRDRILQFNGIAWAACVAVGMYMV